MASGRLDIGTWRAFKKAKGIEKQRLLNQLVQDNEPLTIVLTAQLCGRGENRPGRRQKFKREPYVENLSIEEQESAGRIGMMKALMRFDPKIRDAVRAEHGLGAAEDPAQGLPAFAAWRIKYELQAAIEKSGCMTLRRGVAPQARPGIARMDDPEFVEQAMGESAHYLGQVDGETLEERWQREQADEKKAKEGDKIPSAIDDFITRRCKMAGPGAPPILWEWVEAKYEQHAHAMKQVALPVELGRRMRKHGWEFGRMWHPIWGGTVRSVRRLQVMRIQAFA